MIAIVNTGGANLASISHAISRLGFSAELTSDPFKIKASTHVILPGVGSANHCMENLRNQGLIQVLRDLTQPVLGICLGMQILYEFSEEGDVECLSVLKKKVVRMPSSSELPVPHMGWNQIRRSTTGKDVRLLDGIPDGTDFYFVHSYKAQESIADVAYSDYGGTVPAIVNFKNYNGVQFHPEKSGEAGAILLRNFTAL